MGNGPEKNILYSIGVLQIHDFIYLQEEFREIYEYEKLWIKKEWFATLL